MSYQYTEHHLWILPQADGSITAGITAHAQNMLGDIVFVDMPSIGSRLQAGAPCGVVESVKTASDLHAPLDGEVLEVNDSLRDRPEQLNDTPESAWIFRFRPDDMAQAAALMDAEAYRDFLEK